MLRMLLVNGIWATVTKNTSRRGKIFTEFRISPKNFRSCGILQTVEIRTCGNFAGICHRGNLLKKLIPHSAEIERATKTLLKS